MGGVFSWRVKRCVQAKGSLGRCPSCGGQRPTVAPAQKVPAHNSRPQGFVYVKFGGVPAAAAAQKALHGRWFAGRQIAAVFQFTAVYNSHFGL